MTSCARPTSRWSAPDRPDCRLRSRPRQPGASVTVLDEYPQPGGQFYRQLAGEFTVHDRARLPYDYTKGDALLAAREAAGIEVLNDALVWAASSPATLSVQHRGEMGTIRSFRRPIVASGRIRARGCVSGWDLPGVMTPGGAQTLVKSQRVLPGSRIVLAGSGPFLLPVATTLIEAGAKIAAIYEATRRSNGRATRRGCGVTGSVCAKASLQAHHRRRRACRSATDISSFARKATDCVAARGAREVRRGRPCDTRHRAHRESRHALRELRLRARGAAYARARLRASLRARMGRLDSRTRRGHGDERPTACSSPVRSPASAVRTRRWPRACSPASRGAAARRTAERRTSSRRPARDAAPTARSRSSSQRRLRDQARRLRTITDETLVCRCEEVTAGAVRAAATAWGANVNYIKGVTRCGMGYCQGRVCGKPRRGDRRARRSAYRPGSVDSFHVRAPLKPRDGERSRRARRLIRNEENRWNTSRTTSPARTRTASSSTHSRSRRDRRSGRSAWSSWIRPATSFRRTRRRREHVPHRHRNALKRGRRSRSVPRRSSLHGARARIPNFFVSLSVDLARQISAAAGRRAHQERGGPS